MMSKKPLSVIDIGCGTGNDIVNFLRNGLVATGIDSSFVAIAKARELAKKENGKYAFILMEAEEISKKIKNKFDIIFCKYTYAFIKDKEIFLKNIKKLMHSHSVFVLITPVLHKNTSYTKEDKPGIAVDFDDTKRLLKKKFNTVKIFHHDYFGNYGDSVTFLSAKK